MSAPTALIPQQFTNGPIQAPSTISSARRTEKLKEEAKILKDNPTEAGLRRFLSNTKPEVMRGGNLNKRQLHQQYQAANKALAGSNHQSPLWSNYKSAVHAAAVTAGQADGNRVTSEAYDQVLEGGTQEPMVKPNPPKPMAPIQTATMQDKDTSITSHTFVDDNVTYKISSTLPLTQEQIKEIETQIDIAGERYKALTGFDSNSVEASEVEINISETAGVGGGQFFGASHGQNREGNFVDFPDRISVELSDHKDSVFQYASLAQLIAHETVHHKQQLRLRSLPPGSAIDVYGKPISDSKYPKLSLFTPGNLKEAVAQYASGDTSLASKKIVEGIIAKGDDLIPNLRDGFRLFNALHNYGYGAYAVEFLAEQFPEEWASINNSFGNTDKTSALLREVTSNDEINAKWREWIKERFPQLRDPR